MDEPDSGNQLHKCGECGAGYRRNNALVRHIRSKHEGVRYSCNQCAYQATDRDLLRNTNKPYTKVLDIHVTSVSIRQQHQEMLRDTNKPYTNVLNIPVNSASIRHHNR